jgi:site-specific DNA recombinase
MRLFNVRRSADPSGACDNSRTYYFEDVEKIAVNGLREELRDPRLIAEFGKTYQQERIKLARDAVAKRARAERRHAETMRELERLVDALAKGLATAPMVRVRLLALEDERAKLDDELAAMATPLNIVALHPVALARYLDQIEHLSAELAAGGDLRADPCSTWFRDLVESVIVHPVASKAPLDIELRGYLAQLTEEPRFPPSRRFGGLALVAEEGLEPPTRGL